MAQRTVAAVVERAGVVPSRHFRRIGLTQPGSESHGMVLLEIVLGLALFFITAVFVMDGLSASLRAVDNARLDSTAADLTVTVMSEIQLGLVPMQNEGPHPFDRLGYEDWTWEIVVTELDDLTQFPQLKQVEAIIRNDNELFTHRTSQLMWEDPNAGEGEEEEAEEEIPGLPGVPGIAGLPGVPGAGGLP